MFKNKIYSYSVYFCLHRTLNCCVKLMFTDRVSREGKVNSSVRLSVRPSVCPSVCFHSVFWTDWPSNFLYVCHGVGLWVMTIARLGLKVKVVSRGKRSMPSAYRCGNSVTRSVWPRLRTLQLCQCNLTVYNCTLHFMSNQDSLYSLWPFQRTNAAIYSALFIISW